MISIHAPLTGCDSIKYGLVVFIRPISIHAPLTGCDFPFRRKVWKKRGYFNPRTPYGMRLNSSDSDWIFLENFNPRTPYGMRRSTAVGSLFLIREYFNPRTPYGMRRHILPDAGMIENISNPAPNSWCDKNVRNISMIEKNFNPRTPYGMRRCRW